jgi:hypothetical protein
MLTNSRNLRFSAVATSASFLKRRASEPHIGHSSGRGEWRQAAHSDPYCGPGGAAERQPFAA